MFVNYYKVSRLTITEDELSSFTMYTSVSLTLKNITGANIYDILLIVLAKSPCAIPVSKILQGTTAS